jgi:hypothetical protein
MPDVYLRSIEPLIEVVLGCVGRAHKPINATMKRDDGRTATIKLRGDKVAQLDRKPKICESHAMRSL